MAEDREQRIPAGPTEGLAIALDSREAISRKEYDDSVRRMRIACLVALLFWPAFAPLDLLVAWKIEPGNPWAFLAVRAAGWIVVATIYLILRWSTSPSPRLLRVLDITLFGVGSLLSGLLAGLAGGLLSVYMLGVSMMILGRAALVAEPWQRGVLPFTVVWAGYPLAMVIVGAFDPTVAAQFNEVRAMSMFTVNGAGLAGTAALGLFISNAVYFSRHTAYVEGRLGRYQLKEKLGTGGMGEVWLAEDSTLRQPVALKVLKPEHVRSRTALGRFEREIAATTRLAHPNTVRITDHGVTPDGLWYYAMELLDGCDLAVLIEREGPLPVPRVLHLMRQACGSLAEAHERGFVHRDVKPENLFVATLGGVTDHVKVLDFGIAKVSQDMESTKLTMDGAVTGSPLYLAPEAMKGEEVGPQADVYSLGCVMYAALCGRPPFEGDAPLAVMFKHLEEPPQPLTERLDRPVPDDLEQIVMRCLAKEPADRFADAGELGDALRICRHSAMST